MTQNTHEARGTTDASNGGRSRVATTMAGEPVAVDTELRVMGELQPGEQFLGLTPDEPVLEVVAGSQGQPSRPGWVWTRDRSMSPADADAAIERGEPEPGQDPRDGVFVNGQTEARVKAIRARVQADQHTGSDRGTGQPAHEHAPGDESGR